MRPAEGSLSAKPARSGRATLLLAAWAAVGLVLAGSPSGAASPATGQVGPKDESATWQGPLLQSATVPGPAQCASLSPDMTPACDRFRLTVTVGPSYWEARDGGVSISVHWSDPADEFDLYVLDGSGEQVAHSFGHPPETGAEVFVAGATGPYDVLVVPVNVHDAGYWGEAAFTLQQPEDAIDDAQDDDDEGDADGKGKDGQTEESGEGGRSGGSGGNERNRAASQPTSFGPGSFGGPPSIPASNPSFAVRTFDTTGMLPTPAPNPTEPARSDEEPGFIAQGTESVTRAVEAEREAPSPPRILGLLLPLAGLAVAAAALAIFEPIRDRRDRKVRPAEHTEPPSPEKRRRRG